jgi:hypothetical protein
MVVRLSALRAGRPLPTREIPGTCFYYRLSRPQGHSAAGSVRSEEKSSYLIGNRTPDLAVCSRVSQPTTLPRAPSVLLLQNKLRTGPFFATHKHNGFYVCAYACVRSAHLSVPITHGAEPFLRSRKELPTTSWNPKVHTVFTRALHWSLS